MTPQTNQVIERQPVKPKSKALIVVDMQNDFVYGSLRSKEAEALIPGISQLIEDYANSPDKNSVIFTCDVHGYDYHDTLEGKYLPTSHCTVMTLGAQIVKELSLSKSKYIASYADGNHILEMFSKHSFGFVDWNKCFKGKRHNYDEIEIVGTRTDICVVSNALILRSLFPDKVIRVYENLCSGTTPDAHKAAIEVMKSCMIDVVTYKGKV